MWTVGELAERSGVTVRTLHHYDAIGLLVPTRRDPNGYRRYTDDDVRRLARILFYRELEFPLDEIGALIDDDTVDEPAHLARQSALLEERIERLRRIKKAVDRAMEDHDMTNAPHGLAPDEIREIFGDEYADNAAEYAEEAEARWGDTDAWAESTRRTRQYSKADWEAVRAEGDAINADFVALLAADVPAEDERAMDVAERHRRSIDERFYDCSHEMHTNLADMYVADERFTATYEDLAEGLARYVHDAIHANAVRHA